VEIEIIGFYLDLSDGVSCL